ncbi:inosamine-phosphate amidinotransferase 1, partial [Streptomyces sp. NPDC052196]
MSLVDVHNEWDPLEEIVVGTMRGARVPAPDASLHAVEFSALASAADIPSGPYSQQVVEETEVELNVLAEELGKLGVTVRRPEPRDLSARISTPDWETEGFYDYCPRDGLLT